MQCRDVRDHRRDAVPEVRFQGAPKGKKAKPSQGLGGANVTAEVLSIGRKRVQVFRRTKLDMTEMKRGPATFDARRTGSGENGRAEERG